MKKSTNRIIFWTVVIALIVGSISVIIMSHTSNSKADIPPVSDSDWTLGNENADIVLIEYSDFQCPACVSYHSILGEIIEEFENHIFFVYRHFPLDMIHQNADLASQAAESAGKQGKFWEMYSLLFENQSDWDFKSHEEAENIFAGYAEELGINVKTFLEDLYSDEVKQKVDLDRESAISGEINYTPAFILNGELISNPRNLEDFRNLIKNKIEETS